MVEAKDQVAIEGVMVHVMLSIAPSTDRGTDKC